MRDAWLTALKEKTFHGWPAQAGGLDLKPISTESASGVTLATYAFTSEHDTPLRLYVLSRQNLQAPDLVVLSVLDQQAWESWQAETGSAFPSLATPKPDAASFDQTRKMLESNKWIMVYVAPRGVGPTAFTADDKKYTQILRRFPLLGQTLEGMQVWDTRRAIQALRTLPLLAKPPLWLQSDRRMAGVALYASLFEDHIARLDLHDLPASHVEGPHLLNVLKTLDLPTTVALAAERSRVVLYNPRPTLTDYARQVSQSLHWNDARIQIRD
jgi:hypothetical protein